MISGRARLLRLFSNRTLIVSVAALLGLLMTFKVSQTVQNQQYLSRALTLSESIASMPDVISLVEKGDPQHQLQKLALSIASRTNASYIVIADHEGGRAAHAERLGKRQIALDQLLDGGVFHVGLELRHVEADRLGDLEDALVVDVAVVFQIGRASCRERV